MPENNEFLEEIRSNAIAQAEARGLTLEEQLDAYERVTGSPKGALDSYRILFGIKC